MRRAWFIALLASIALPAHAQSLSERLAEMSNIPFEAWQAMTSGKTVVYEINGQLAGLEAYRPDSNRVLFQTDGGFCDRGTWAMQGPAYCFQWEVSGLDCFLHKKLDGEIYVISLAGGSPTGQIQKVAQISDIPLNCGPDLLSQLVPEASP